MQSPQVKKEANTFEALGEVENGLSMKYNLIKSGSRIGLGKGMNVAGEMERPVGRGFW